MTYPLLCAMTAVLAGTSELNLSVSSEDHYLSQAIEEARTIESTHRMPFSRMRGVLVVMEVAALESETGPTGGGRHLDAARRVVGAYRGIGHEAGPILMALMSQSISHGKAAPDTLDALRESLKKGDNMAAFRFFLQHGAHIRPALTQRMISDACPASHKETCRAIALLQLAQVNPSLAWAWRRRLPACEDTQTALQASVPLVFAVACSRARGITSIPDDIKQTVATTCTRAFTEAHRRHYRGEFSIDTMAIFGGAWYAVAPKDARKAILFMSANVSMPGATERENSWDRQWQVACRNARNTLMLSGLLDLVEAPDAETTWRNAVGEVTVLSELLTKQPSAHGSGMHYTLDADGLAKHLPLVSLRTTGRLLEVLQKDGRIGKPQETWLSVIACHARSRPNLAATLVSRLDSPVLRAEAWLVIARAQLPAAGE